MFQVIYTHIHTLYCLSVFIFAFEMLVQIKHFSLILHRHCYINIGFLVPYTDNSICFTEYTQYTVIHKCNSYVAMTIKCKIIAYGIS